MASNLLESLGGAVQRKLQPGGVQSFDAAMARTGSSTATTVARNTPTLAEQIETIRTQLLNTPELQTMVHSSDSTQASSLSITPGGIVSYSSPDGRANAMALSPETSALARSLGGLLSQANGGVTTGTFPLATGTPRPSLSVYA